MRRRPCELAELYQARWEIETALGSLKAQVKGPGVVLRSKTPDGVVQEIWALLCAYHAVRELISAAAALAAEDPMPCRRAWSLLRIPAWRTALIRRFR